MSCRRLCARKSCFDLCSKQCPSACDRKDLSPPLPSAPNRQNQKHAMSTGVILMISMIGAVMLLVGILCTILKLYNLRLERSRRRNSPILFETQETFLDENRGPENSEIEHHIWYINTIGLQQSVIEAITVCKYKKDEGLIDGTECSICLGEFEEDDSLRLLPKCSHAFHLPCIDTWLRSHKNCPLCRAPIVRDAGSVNLGVVQPNFNDSGSNEDVEVENFENNIELGGDQVVEVRVGDGDSGALPIADQTFDRNPKRVLPNSIARNSDSQVLSDLAHNQRVVEEDMQPVRRSVSLDSSSAKMIYLAVANAIPDKDRGASNSNLDLKSASKRGSGSSSIYKLMKSSSIGRSLQKGPVSMKRSFSSSSGKFLSSRHSKSQDSILPL